MLIAEPPCEQLSGASAPAVLLPIALPLAGAAGAAAPAFAIPPELAPAILKNVPVVSAFKPNAALAVSLALHVCLVAGVLRLR